MIVDDSESDQYLTQVVLEEYNNIHILQAYDGEEALQMLAELRQQPDVIFLDINMPRMNGFEFLEEYCKGSDYANIVAMLTSSDQEIDQERAMRYKCVKAYFTKPIDVDDLKSLEKLD